MNTCSRIFSIFSIVVILFSPYSVYAIQFKAGKHYVVLEKPATPTPQIVEFFSFYCSQCYHFKHELYLSKAVKNCLPPDGQLIQYHIKGFGPLAKELTRAWAIAIILGVEEKMSRILFDGIQKDDTLHSADDIRQAFINAGITTTDYDNAINSLLVNSLVKQQEDAAREADIYGVPTLLINGKYLTQLDKLPIRRSTREFMCHYLQLINHLLATIHH